MDIKQLSQRSLISAGVLIVATVTAYAGGTQQVQSPTPGTRPSIAQADASSAIPHDVPKAAAQAMQLALKWHSDAQMIDVRVRQSNDYALEFDFKSPSDRGFFYVQSIKGRFTSQVMSPVTTSATGGPLPLEFLDLPAAIAKAQQLGMPPVIKEASLQISSRNALVWAIQPETDDEPYLYTINAAPGAVASGGGSPSSPAPANARAGQPAPQTGSGSNLAVAGADPVMASGLLQQCLGITRGADKMMRGPATREFCAQLPGASLFDQAGERFQAGDHAGAAEIVRKAADAGNAVAQLRLALMSATIEPWTARWAESMGGTCSTAKNLRLVPVVGSDQA